MLYCIICCRGSTFPGLMFWAWWNVFFSCEVLSSLNHEIKALNSCCIFLINELFGRTVIILMFSPFFSHTWKCFFNCGINSSSIEVLLPLKSVKWDIFIFMALNFLEFFHLDVLFMTIFQWKVVSLLISSRVFIKEETVWVCSVLKLYKSSVMSYWEPEETTASYTKLLGSFAIYFLHFSQIPYPFWMLGTFIIQSNTDLRVF